MGGTAGQRAATSPLAPHSSPAATISFTQPTNRHFESHSSTYRAHKSVGRSLDSRSPSRWAVPLPPAQPHCPAHRAHCQTCGGLWEWERRCRLPRGCVLRSPLGVREEAEQTVRKRFNSVQYEVWVIGCGCMTAEKCATEDQYPATAASQRSDALVECRVRCAV